jgi:predicted RNA-binding protein YlxR (DUF448 family)
MSVFWISALFVAGPTLLRELPQVASPVGILILVGRPGALCWIQGLRKCNEEAIRKQVISRREKNPGD